MNYNEIKFSLSWTCEWKLSDEMGPKATKSEGSRLTMERQKCKPSNWYPVFDKVIHKSITDIIDIHNFIMDVYDSIIDIDNSVM